MPQPSRVTMALVLAMGAAVGAHPMQAQGPDVVDITVRNRTSNCAWITLYKKDASGPFGVLAGAEQIKIGDRKNTGPLFIPPGQQYVFHIPRPPKGAIRAEFKEDTKGAACHDNATIGETMMELANVKAIDEYTFALYKDPKKGNYYIQP